MAERRSWLRPYPPQADESQYLARCAALCSHLRALLSFPGSGPAAEARHARIFQAFAFLEHHAGSPETAFWKHWPREFPVDLDHRLDAVEALLAEPWMSGAEPAEESEGALLSGFRNADLGAVVVASIEARNRVSGGQAVRMNPDFFEGFLEPGDVPLPSAARLVAEGCAEGPPPVWACRAVLMSPVGPAPRWTVTVVWFQAEAPYPLAGDRAADSMEVEFTGTGGTLRVPSAILGELAGLDCGGRARRLPDQSDEL